MALVVKVCLLGDGAVGKTSLKNRFMGTGFLAKYLTTVGADFAVRTVKLPDLDVEYRLQIWDLAGQPRFDAVRIIYYTGSVGAIMVFDIANRESLANLQKWGQEFQQHSTKTAVPMIIFGNKKDLRGHFPSCVTEEEGKQFAEALPTKLSLPGMKFPYLETSAKTGENVEEGFTKLVREIHSCYQSGEF